MGSQPIEKNEAPAGLWQGYLTGDIAFKVESSMEPGNYIQEIPFIVWSDEPMANHKVDNYWAK